MNPQPEQDLMLMYVAGVTDADETARAEALLSAAGPAAQAAYAEALAVFHAVPLALTPVAPPASVRDGVMGRVAASTSSPVLAALANERPASGASPSRDAIRPAPARWPVYFTSGLAACLAVALSMTLWNSRGLADNNRRLAIDNQAMADRTTRATADNRDMADRVSRLSATLAGSESVLRSSHATLASLETQDRSTKSYGRVLYCPVTRQYQVTVFGLSPLPSGKAYELWLITPDQRKVPAGTFTVNADGTATVMARPSQAVDIAALAAVTDEPAGGSAQPTGSIHLAGALAATTN